jgi:hypothetical protein
VNRGHFLHHHRSVDYNARKAGGGPEDGEG